MRVTAASLNANSAAMFAAAIEKPHPPVSGAEDDIVLRSSRNKANSDQGDWFQQTVDGTGGGTYEGGPAPAARGAGKPAGELLTGNGGMRGPKKAPPGRG